MHTGVMTTSSPLAKDEPSPYLNVYTVWGNVPSLREREKDSFDLWPLTLSLQEWSCLLTAQHQRIHGPGMSEIQNIVFWWRLIKFDATPRSHPVTKNRSLRSFLSPSCLDDTHLNLKLIWWKPWDKFVKVKMWKIAIKSKMAGFLLRFSKCSLRLFCASEHDTPVYQFFVKIGQCELRGCVPGGAVEPFCHAHLKLLQNTSIFTTLKFSAKFGKKLSMLKPSKSQLIYLKKKINPYNFASHGLLLFGARALTIH